MNIFQMFFLEKELKQIFLALHQAESEIGCYSFSIIRKSVEQCILVSMKGRVKQVLDINNATPITMVYCIIANVVADYLSTGQYHVYRGLLNFTGQDLYKILNICLKKIEQVGFTFGSQSAKEFRAVVDREIQEVG